MKHVGKVVLALFLAIVSGSGNARELVYWYIPNFPPIHIVSGPDQGTGTGDERLRILFKRMPEFDHQIVVASALRIIEAMKSQPNVCNPTFIKTPERAMFFEYSNAFSERLPNGIITLQSRVARIKPFLDRNDELSVEALLSSGEVRLGIIEGRVFGVGIDAVLKKHNKSAALVVVPASDALESRLLKLAHQSEFDAVVGYAHELRYLTRKLGLTEKQFVFFPAAEEPPTSHSYAACAKSDVGMVGSGS